MLFFKRLCDSSSQGLKEVVFNGIGVSQRCPVLEQVNKKVVHTVFHKLPVLHDVTAITEQLR